MVALREREYISEREPDASSVSLIVFDKKKEKVLLVRHTKERKEGMVGFPGGRPLRGSNESLVDAGIRELREETGLRTNAENLLSYPNNVYVGLIPRTVGEDIYYSYRALICVGHEGQQKKASEEGRPFWASISKLDRYGTRLTPSVKTAVSEALNFLNNQ